MFHSVTDYTQYSNFASKNYTVFNTTTLLTTQVDALPVKASYCGVISSYNHVEETGVPVNAAGYVEIYSESVNYKRLFFCPMGSTDVYVKDKSSNGWGDWVKIPTRSEVDSLNNSMTKIILSESLSVPKDSSATVTLPSKTGSFLCAWRGTNAVWRGIALITKASTSDGVCTVLSSNMSSVSESGNVLTFTNQHSSNDQTYCIRVTEIGV